jgi:PAS domain S-box-containing protein
VLDTDDVHYGRVWFFHDITEQKNAADKLRQSEEKYRVLIENANDSVYTLNLEGNFTSLNRAGEQIFGYTRDEALSMNIADVVSSKDLERVRERIAKNLAGEAQPNFELEVITKDGKLVIMDISSRLIYQDGVVVGIQGIGRDITERKRGEEALEQSERDYRTVFEQAHDAIMVFAPEQETVLDVNERACELYGFNRAEFIGMSLETLSKNPASGTKLVKETLEAGENLNFETVQYRRDGSEMFLEVNASTIIYQGRQAIITINRDITGRKEAEIAIAEANDRAIREYERLLDRIAQMAESLGSARDLLTIYRTLYNFALVSLPCNGLFISLYDAARNVRSPAYACSDGQEIDVATLPDMVMSDSPNSRAISTGTVIIEDDFQAAMQGKPIVNVGLDIDPRLPQSCLITPMSVMGRIVGAVEVQSIQPAAFRKEHATSLQMAANLVANAIENVRLLEQERESAEQLRQSQKLESVGRLAGGIAHDFNNMLTAINGYSELTLRRLKPDDPLRENVEEIKKAGERSAALTHQLLAFSRQQVLQSKVLDLNEIIIDTTTMLQRLIGEDILLNSVLNPELGRLEGDAGQLTQVLMNLVVNARDAMPDGGTLTIETTNVNVDEEFAAAHLPIMPGPYVLLAITDTGIGIDEETQQHIFEPFYTTKEIGKGTGLGLATVYGIVKQSGGYIWVTSKPGKGSTFEIYLPRIEQEVWTESEAATAEYLPNGAETILIVEDEDLVRALTRQVLEECGYEIIEARNGVEALSIFEQPDCKIDLLLTDVVMPQMGGRELAERVTRTHPNLRVLFTSGYTDDAAIRQDVIVPDTNFIQKPFTFDALAHKVRESLDSNTAL